MKVYRKESKSVLKWILALLIFVLTMTITFNDVEGIGVPPTNNSIENNQTKPADSRDFDFQVTDDSSGDSGTQTDGGGNDLTPVPEPTTLILLAAGLGVVRLVTRRKEQA